MAAGTEQYWAEQKVQAAIEVGRLVESLIYAVDRMLEADGHYFSKVEEYRYRGDKRREMREAATAAVVAGERRRTLEGDRRRRQIAAAGMSR